MDEKGKWQVEADAAILEWQEGDIHYSIRQAGLGLGCEDLLKIVG
jgi:hypothetical protein